MPANGVVTEKLREGERLMVQDHILAHPKGNELSNKPAQVCRCIHLRPIKPAQGRVLAIGVVVSHLGASHLIAHAQHGRTQGENKQGEKIAALPEA